jgi:hypothetical protein
MGECSIILKREFFLMKFTRPINREVEINDVTFIVSLDESGIGFRLKGKRRVARLDWSEALEMARGEQGASARDFLGLASAETQRASREDETEIDAHREPPARDAEEVFQPQGSSAPDDDDRSRTVTAAQTGTES